MDGRFCPRRARQIDIRARRKLEDRAAREHLERIALALHEAHGACDIDAARQRRDTVGGRCCRRRLVRRRSVFRDGRRAVEWLADQEQIAVYEAEHGAAVARLEGGLAGKSEADELRRRHKAAVAHGYRLSADLETRYRDRLERLARDVRLRRLAVFAGISAVLLLAVGLIFYGVRTYRFDHDVAEQKTVLAALLDGGDLPAAKALVARIKENSPSIAASEEIQALELRLETALAKEADRHRSFEGFLQAAAVHGPENPDHEALQTATELAKNDVERLEIQQFKDAVAAADRAAEARAAPFRAALEPFKARIKALDALRGDPPQLQAELDRVRSDLKNLETQSGEISSEAKGHENEILSALEAAQTALKREREENEQLVAVTAAVGDPQAFKAELARLCPAVPRFAARGGFQTDARAVGHLGRRRQMEPTAHRLRPDRRHPPRSGRRQGSVGQGQAGAR